MKRILITGGSGTVGSAFIKNYYDRYRFGSVSRNERLQHELKNTFPDVDIYIGSVEDELALSRIVGKFMPDIIIHSAAMKHVNLAETNPTQALKVNIIGSLNVVKSVIKFRIPITVGISTDKACEPTSVYGMTKVLMEKIFMEHNSFTSKFVICRFGNVAFSNGSILPFWMGLKKEGKPLPITDPRMRRFFFSKKDAAELIHAAIDLCGDGGSILIKKLRTVFMIDLAKKISSDVQMVGRRPGEKLNEGLVSLSEISYSRDLGDNIKIFGVPTAVGDRLSCPYNTKTAKPMADEEMEALLNEVCCAG